MLNSALLFEFGVRGTAFEGVAFLGVWKMPSSNKWANSSSSLIAGGKFSLSTSASASNGTAVEEIPPLFVGVFCCCRFWCCGGLTSSNIFSKEELTEGSVFFWRWC